ncbi:hypothetical protein UFOVP132_22 [uncultured Caudovirales phage]|jgi:hypothetical protein|uniref:Uncharacterized protein n=1 Tax=uncultured Caudovirales phage TaxID=2100421 RepID=A0A6J5LBZ4_9CAUD|nr:hypothetical protein UFOVP132_22 [uncultured Caudovirales phage]
MSSYETFLVFSPLLALVAVMLIGLIAVDYIGE